VRPLTAVETEILRRAANGQTYAAIGREMGYQEKSVSKMALRLARKLGAYNITHAVHLAHLSGVLRRERHGDHAGFAAHVYRDEDPCDDCKAGERAYRADQRRRRREKRQQEQPVTRGDAAA
jgi:DNA-binding CsgD family transcriptional regulator